MIKRPKKKILHTSESTSTSENYGKRILRKRRGKEKEELIEIDCDEMDKEQRDIDEAIMRSLKETDNNVVTIDDSFEKIDLYAHIDKQIELFRYNHLTIRMEDYLCLGKAQYLSNVNIDFMLNYIYHEKFSSQLKEKVYIFPTEFFSIYSTNAEEGSWWKNPENAGLDSSTKRYNRVKLYGMIDENVNYYDKDFLVFPMLINNHWLLAIVCFPYLATNLNYADNSPTDDNRKWDAKFELPPIKKPVILVFDSLRTKNRSGTVGHHL